MDAQSILVNGPTLIGYHLEQNCAVRLTQQLSSPLTVTLTSNDTTKLLLAKDPTAVGTQSITVTIPANSTTSELYYLQAVGCPVINPSLSMCEGQNSTTATYTASGGSLTDSGTVTLTPSGVFFEAGGFSFFASVAGGSVPVAIDVAQLDPATKTINSLQPVAALPGSTSLQLSVDTDKHSVGTVTSPAVAAGSFTTDAIFTPVASGSTVLSLSTPANFGSTGIFQKTTANVTP